MRQADGSPTDHGWRRALLTGLLLIGGGARGAEPPVALDPAARDNLVGNAGFDEGAALPAWWSRHPAANSGRNAHARDTGTAHSGAASGRITWLDPIEGPNQAALQWNRYQVPVEGGTDLLFSCLTRTDGVPAAGAGVHFYGAGGEHLGFVAIPGPDRAESWTLLRQDAAVPPGAVRLGLALYTRRGGTTWYDDVALVGTPSALAARATPRVDGSLADDCWSAAASVSFARPDGSGPDPLATRAWVAADEERLYVAFDCPQPAAAAVPAGGAVAGGEAVDVWLDTRHEHRESLHIAVGRGGDVRCTGRPGVAGEPVVVAGTGASPAGWCAEVAIPYRGLDVRLESAANWGLNLGRRQGNGGVTAVWSVAGADRPARFGNVTLAADPLALRRAALAREAERLGAEHEQVAGEVAATGLVRERAGPVFASLDGAAAGVARLRRIAVGEESPADASVAGLGPLVASVRGELSAARQAAPRCLFAVPAAAPGQPGLHVLVVGSLEKVRRESPPVGRLATQVEMDAARDEAESVQLVVVPDGGDLAGIRVEAQPLSGPGPSLPVTVYRVGYVRTGEPKGYRPEYVGWWPDVLLPPAPFAVAAGECQPVWCRVDVPPEAVPGVYRGVVRVGLDERSVAVPIKLRVRSFRLPRPGTLACPFGLYASALAEWYHGKHPYREVMPVETFARWCEFMGRYRLTPKNVGEEYGQRPPPADARDGGGLEPLRTTVGDLAPRYYPPYSFGLYRLPCSRDVQDGTTRADPAVWVRALSATVSEYRRLGLPAQAYVYGIDEPVESGYPFIRDVYRRVREAVPDVPILQTVNHEPPRDLAGLVGIWCPLTQRLQDAPAFYQARRQAGDTLWTYVCCSPKPPYTNFFIDQPALAHRLLFWQVRQAGATGLLYWCVCWWQGIPGPTAGTPCFPDVPVQLGDGHSTWRELGVNGDGVLVWPGPGCVPYPSLRLEVIRDGIEDYEYLALLEACVARATALPPARRPDPVTLGRAAALCQVPPEITRGFSEYSLDADRLLARRRAVAEAIEALDVVLADPAGPP